MHSKYYESRKAKMTYILERREYEYLLPFFPSVILRMLVTHVTPPQDKTCYNMSSGQYKCTP